MSQTHMAREVAEIPQAAARFLDQSRQAVLDAAAALRRKDPDLIVTVARGSSDHAATYLKYAIELEAGIPVASVGPSVASIAVSTSTSASSASDWAARTAATP